MSDRLSNQIINDLIHKHGQAGITTPGGMAYFNFTLHELHNFVDDILVAFIFSKQNNTKPVIAWLMEGYTRDDVLIQEVSLQEPSDHDNSFDKVTSLCKCNSLSIVSKWDL